MLRTHPRAAPNRGVGKVESPLTVAQHQVLFEDAARTMGKKPEEIRRRRIGNCTKCDPVYGAVMAKVLVDILVSG